MPEDTMDDRPGANPTRRAGMFQELLGSAALTWRLLLDPRVPAAVKLVPAAVMAYLLFPIDLVPDWLLGLGQLDDLAIILLGIRAFIALCPPEIVAWYRRATARPASPQRGRDDTIDGTFRVMDE